MSHIYMEEDINKAFNLGLEAAVYILEQSIDLSRDGQKLMIDCIKRMVEYGKVSYFDGTTFIDSCTNLYSC